LKSLLYN